jgi:putative component of toxin-antitoxin plasmid stabilization module
MPYIVEQTELFAKWHESVKDQKAKLLLRVALKEQSMAT